MDRLETRPTTAQSIQGTYRIQHVPSGLFLSLCEGLWDGVPLRLAPTAAELDTVTTRDQQWLIAPRPDRKASYIVSLFYGVQLSKTDDATGFGLSVCVEPANAENPNLFWQLDTVQDSDVFSIRCMRDYGYSISLKDSQIGYTDTTPRTLWRMIPLRLSPITSLPPSWLTHIPSSTPLDLINLPGTHQSLSLHGVRLPAYSPSHPGYSYPLVDNPRCQNRCPLEQVLDGIRVFDLRFAVHTSPNGPSLFAQHGPARMGYTFLAVLLSMLYFLQRNAGESVILFIRNETNSSDPVQFLRAFKADLSLIPDEMLFNPGNRSMRDINLGEIRGKIVIVGHETNLGTDYASSSTFFSPSEKWMKETKFNHLPFRYPYKIANAARLFEHARLSSKAHIETCGTGNPGKRTSYMTSWNQSILGIINPIDAAEKLMPAIKAQYTPEKCGKVGVYRFGMVNLDFYELFAEELGNIVRSNQGCGEL